MSDGTERQGRGPHLAARRGVEIDGARRITAHVGGGLERNFIRLLVGDRVVVELTPRDLTQGRVVKKL